MITFCLLVATSVFCTDSYAQCELEIAAVDTFGANLPINGRIIILRDVFNQQSRSIELPAARRMNVPCSTYSVSFAKSVFSVGPQLVTLPGADGLTTQRIIFNLQLYPKGDRHNPHLLLTFSDYIVNDDGDVIYSLLPVYAGEPIVQRRSKAKGVLFQYVPAGRYVLLIEHGSQVIAIQDIGEVREGYSLSTAVKKSLQIRIEAISSELAGDVIIREN
jgi:hypothetical protein